MTAGKMGGRLWRVWRVLLLFGLMGGGLSTHAQENVTPTPGGQIFRGRVVRVDAGDQIGVQVQAGGWTPTVRLHGVDCPVAPPDLARLARTYSERRVLNQMVSVQVKGTGPKETVYGEVTPDNGQSLNAELVRVGLATWAQQYAPARTELGKLQVEAQNARRGMWDDVHGASVVLPTPRPSATPIPAATAAPKPTPKPAPRRTSKPSAAATPASRPKILPLPHVALWGSVAFVLVSAAAFVFLRRFAGFADDGTTAAETAALPAPAGSRAANAAPLVPTLLCSASAGLCATLLVPLPLLFVSRLWAATHPAIVALVAVPLLFLCGHYAIAWTRREQVLRAAPRLKDGGIRQKNRLVKIGGQSVVGSTDVVYSVVGRIPGLYMREVTSRYEAQQAPTGSYQNGKKRATSYRWVVHHQDTRTADFFVASSDNPPIKVASEWGEFYPLRVARFYNEIPVDKWFNQAYVGDTRTEIQFIPPHVPVTVWGQLRQTAAPVAGEQEDRLGYDAAHDCLVVVEGDPARLWTRRPLLGLLMTLAGAVLIIVVAYCLVTPPELFVL